MGAARVATSNVVELEQKQKPEETNLISCPQERTWISPLFSGAVCMWVCICESCLCGSQPMKILKDQSRKKQTYGVNLSPTVA